MNNNATRRQLLMRIAAVGGSAPLVKTMSALGLMQASVPSHAFMGDDKESNPELGKGKTVAIIGSGLSGLTAAYELSQRGFNCLILEADNRAKGRTFTVRPDGTSDSWYQESGRDPEVCTFDEVDGVGSLYFEAGAGRIPSHHRMVLHYCQKFGVELESYIFSSRANLVRSDQFNGGAPVQLRQFKHNLRGYLAEMLRTVDPKALDIPLSKQEKELLNDLAISFGDLSDIDDSEKVEMRYLRKRSRAGYKPPGPGPGDEPGEYWEPFALADLLQAKEIWQHQLFKDMSYYWQSSLMQPVGGIDNVAAAFMRQSTPSGKRVGNLIRLSRKVVSIIVGSKKVSIEYEHVNQLGERLSNDREAIEVDYCISTIGPSLLAKITNNFTEAFQNALVHGVSNVPACKVAWQSDRFWESDKYQIYGGISWTSDQIGQIWYPSTGFNNKRGVLTGAYVRGRPAFGFAKLSKEERVRVALEEGEKLHPELNPENYSYHNPDKAMTIAWQNMPFQDGGWYDYTPEQRKTGYPELLKTQADRFFMAGDALSYTPGWMEGAISAGLSATDKLQQQLLRDKASSL